MADTHLRVGPHVTLWRLQANGGAEEVALAEIELRRLAGGSSAIIPPA